MSIRSIIDTHCHIIPGVDDGAYDINESLNMARELSNSGIESIIATPHMNYKYCGEKYNKKVNKNFKMLKDALAEENININLYLGHEVQTIEPMLNKEKLLELLIEDTNIILIEPAVGQDINYINEFIYTLSVWNITPIIAHAERIEVLHDNFNVLEEWLDSGVYIQMNLLSLLGKYGRKPKRIASKLLKYNLVSMIGSDAHTVNDAANIEKSINILSKMVSEEYFADLVENNPREIFNIDIDIQLAGDKR